MTMNGFTGIINGLRLFLLSQKAEEEIFIMHDLYIIITTYNAQMIIRHCLRSLEKNLYELEVIIIEGAMVLSRNLTTLNSSQE